MPTYHHGSPDKTLKVAKKPWQPRVTSEQILAFDPARPETHTPSPLVNEVLSAMHLICPLSSRAVGQYLCVSHTKLSAALELETGMSFSELRDKWTRHRLPLLKAAHPDWTMDQIARAVGYADQSSLWRASHREKRREEYRAFLRYHEIFLAEYSRKTKPESE